MSTSAPMSDSPLTRTVLRDGVYDRILTLLLQGAWPGGDRISIDGLARELQVSPTPVREALAHLEFTGLVTREALRGYRVAPPLTRDQLDCLVDARVVVESAALDKAMQHQPEFGEQLEAAHAFDVELVDRRGLRHPTGPVDLDAYREYFAADWGFHQVILHSCANPYLERMGEGLSFQVHRMRQTYTDRVLDADDAIREHQAILDAVLADDVAAASQALLRHLEGVRARSLSGEGTPAR